MWAAIGSGINNQLQVFGARAHPLTLVNARQVRTRQGPCLKACRAAWPRPREPGSFSPISSPK